MADEKKQGEVVDPQDAVEHGYWGYNPVEKDRSQYSFKGAGAVAEEAAKGGARAEGPATVDKSSRERQTVRKPAAKEEGR